MARDKIWPRTWNTYPELPGYQIKFNVDTKSGLVFGFLVALRNESNPDDNHVHYWYERNTGHSGYQMKSGNTKFQSSFSDHVISDIAERLPSLLMK